jgi:hypothetical protein
MVAFSSRAGRPTPVVAITQWHPSSQDVFYFSTVLIAEPIKPCYPCCSSHGGEAGAIASRALPSPLSSLPDWSHAATLDEEVENLSFFVCSQLSHLASHGLFCPTWKQVADLMLMAGLYAEGKFVKKYFDVLKGGSVPVSFLHGRDKPDTFTVTRVGDKLQVWRRCQHGGHPPFPPGSRCALCRRLHG